MTSIKCPNCNLINFADAQNCKRCKAEMTVSPLENVVHQLSDTGENTFHIIQQTPTGAAPPANAAGIAHTTSTRSTGAAEIVTGVFWLLFLPYAGFIFLTLSGSLVKANGAPQEAAAAAMAAAYVIIPYCALRALTAAIRQFQGK